MVLHLLSLKFSSKTRRRWQINIGIIRKLKLQKRQYFIVLFKLHYLRYLYFKVHLLFFFIINITLSAIKTMEAADQTSVLFPEHFEPTKLNVGSFLKFQCCSPPPHTHTSTPICSGRLGYYQFLHHSLVEDITIYIYSGGQNCGHICYCFFFFSLMEKLT